MSTSSTGADAMGRAGRRARPAPRHISGAGGAGRGPGGRNGPDLAGSAWHQTSTHWSTRARARPAARVVRRQPEPRLDQTVASGGKSAIERPDRADARAPERTTPLAIRIRLAQLLEQDLLDGVEREDRVPAAACRCPAMFVLPVAGTPLTRMARVMTLRLQARSPAPMTPASSPRVAAPPGPRTRARCSGGTAAAQPQPPRRGRRPGRPGPGRARPTTVSMAAARRPPSAAGRQRRWHPIAPAPAAPPRSCRRAARPPGSAVQGAAGREYLGAATPAAIASGPAGRA